MCALCQITRIHFDFTTPEGLKTTLRPEDNRERRTRKEDKRVEEKKTDLPLNFNIVYFEKKKCWNEQDTGAIFSIPLS